MPRAVDSFSFALGGAVNSQGLVIDKVGNAWFLVGLSGYDFVLAKVSSAGDLVQALGWRYSGGNRYAANVEALITDAQGDLWITGYLGSIYELLLIKLSSEGTLLHAHSWSRIERGYSHSTALAFDSSGSLWMAGYIQNFGVLGDEVLLAQFSADGNLTQAIHWGGSSRDRGYGLAIDSQDSVWVTGYTQSFDVTTNAFLAKFSPDGNLTQAIRWVGIGNDVAIDAQDSVWVTGYTRDFGAAGEDVFLVKFSSGFNLTQAVRWGGTSNDEGNAIAIDAQGSIWVAGSTSSFGAASSNAFLAQFSPDGNLTRAVHWGLDDTDYGHALAIDEQGSIWTTGTLRFSKTSITNVFVAKMTASLEKIAGLLPTVDWVEIEAQSVAISIPLHTISNASTVINASTVTDVSLTVEAVTPAVTGLSFYQTPMEVNHIEYAPGVMKEYTLNNQSFAGRYPPYELYVQQKDGTALPSWLKYSSVTGILSGVWPVKSDYDRLDLIVGYKKNNKHRALRVGFS